MIKSRLIRFPLAGCLAFSLVLSCKTTSPDSSSELQKIHSNIPVGEYSSDRSLHIKNCNGTFLSFMKTSIFPVILREADKDQMSKLDGVKAGHGVEVRFADDVTTYHVGFPASDRGGRSYGGVGADPRMMEYVADVSYTDYFKGLEKAYWNDREGLIGFYQAVLGTLLNCNVSAIESLSIEYKRSFSDFMAVFIAEQYRNLISNSRDSAKPYSKTSDWDNAHLQTTLLAAFHSGQTKDFKGMMWWGKFTDKTYDTFDDCPIYVTRDTEGKPPRSFRLMHYTQANRDCKRSGVNMTRRDWELLTKEIGERLKASKAGQKVIEEFESENGVEAIANWITTNSHDKTAAGEAKLNAAVGYVKEMQKQGLAITKELLERDAE